MGEVEVKAERKRKPKFSSFEISVFTENEKNIDVIQSKLTNKSGRKIPRR